MDGLLPNGESAPGGNTGDVNSDNAHCCAVPSKLGVRYGMLCMERTYSNVAVSYNGIAIREAVDYQISETSDGEADITLRLKIKSPIATFAIATSPEVRTS